MHTLIEHLRCPQAPGERRLVGPSATYQPIVAVWLIDMTLRFGWHTRVGSYQCPLGDENFLAYLELPEEATAAIRREHEGNSPATALAYESLIREQRAAMLGRPLPGDAPLFTNITALADTLGLNVHEQFILTFTALRAALWDFEAAMGMTNQKVTTADLCEVFASLSKLDVAGFKRALAPESSLVASGIVGVEAGGCDIERKLSLLRGLGAALIEDDLQLSQLLRRFVSPAAKPTLTPSDFPHLGTEMRTLVALLCRAQSRAASGLNILLYGAPGLGKTEFCQVLAHASGYELLEVAYADTSGAPLTGGDRLRAYRFSEQLLAPAGRSVLMFDEVEDVFRAEEVAAGTEDKAQRVQCKAWINRALEQSRTPTIWITNRVREIDSAFLRRFDFTIEFRNPPLSARRRIAARHLGALAPSDTWLDTLAANPHIIPSQYERAARIAAGVPADEAIVAAEVSLRQSTRVLHRRALKLKRTDSTAFKMDWITTDQSVAAVLAGLRRHPHATMCFYGPPGTGKTAFARHLADALDRPLIVERASDILSPYVGVTEQNLAELFERAQADDALLLIDEADSFLGDRSHARRNWEVTQVNELLTQIEEFEGLLVCTTNRLDQMDPASRRRFSHKIRFDAMPSATAWQVCREVAAQLGIHDLGLADIRADILCMAGLTPGDFAVAIKQASLLDEAPNAVWLRDALRAEITGRRGTTLRIGFAA